MASLLTPSPCIGTCRLDPSSQLCTGCARTSTEITAWKDASPADRARTWADLPARRARLDIGLHRLGWLPDQILDFVAQTLRGKRGSWTVGLDDASARFCIGDGAVKRDGSTITATSAAGSIRFTIHDRVRVLAVPDRQRGERIILAVPRSQSLPTPTARLTPLSAGLYDLGLGSESASVCVRVLEPTLQADLDRRTGLTWASVPRDLRDRLARAATSWVIQGPVARLELPGALDPLIHRLGADTGADVPESFIPCATFDPG